jgi:hypothetical protein
MNRIANFLGDQQAYSNARTTRLRRSMVGQCLPCSEMIDRHSFDLNERTNETYTTSLEFCVPVLLFILRSNDENPKRHCDWRIPDAIDQHS